jgi:hypothetical protein
VLQAGCAEAPPDPQPALRPLFHTPALAGQQNTFSITIPGKPGAGPGYVWQGRHFDDSSALIAAVGRDVARQIDSIPVQDTPLGSLRLIMPVRPPLQLQNDRNPEGVAEAVEADARFHRTLDDGRLAALRKANLFAPIRVSVEDVSVADNDGADFALWLSGGRWHLRYRHGDTLDINDLPDVARWANVISSVAHSEMRNYNPDSLSYAAHFDNNGKGAIRFYFAGADYFSVDDLGTAMKAAWLKSAANIRPVQHPIGRRIRIVLPENLHWTTFSMGVGGIVHANEMRQAQEAFHDASTAGYIAAIRNSHMFSEVVVETRDVTDVPLDSCDATLWQSPTAPFQWAFRVVGQADARMFRWPSRNPTLQEWINALDAQMRRTP